MNTNDLSKLRYREIDMLADLLKAYANNSTVLGDGVNWEFNPNSGNVFLVDEDYRVAMLNDDNKLAEWFSCPNCGHEGFQDDYGDVVTDEENGDLLICKKCHDADAAFNI